MVKRLGLGLLTIALMVFLFLPSPGRAAGDAIETAPAFQALGKLDKALQTGDMNRADRAFDAYKAWWLKNKNEIKKQSLTASSQIEQQTANISIALLNDQKEDAAQALKTLEDLLTQYKEGAFADTNPGEKASLSTYIKKLESTKTLIKEKKWPEAEQHIRMLQQEWLTVEGDVVSQSQTVYTESEKNLVLLSAYIAQPDSREKALPLIEDMINALKPLAATKYGLIDAAMIPLREGLEALLVVGALLSFAKKAESKRANRWIWGGALAALAVCLGIGCLVSFALSSLAFSQNNALINGLSGVLASVMLLYVSYWLHRNADIKRWNAFIRAKSEKAITNGRMMSFAAIAFLAILREGIETVIFLIGMVGRMSAGQLIGGIALGCAALAAIGVLMLKVGVKLPLKPFFLVSSFIVFYLCFKFMGSGINSLQMAGILPSAVENYLPSVPFLSIYPSWYSTAPQALFLAAALVTVLNNLRLKWSHALKTKEAS